MSITISPSVLTNPIYKPEIIEFIVRMINEAKRGYYNEPETNLEIDDICCILDTNSMGDMSPYTDEAKAIAIGAYDIESIIGIDPFAEDEERQNDPSCGADFRVSCVAIKRYFADAGLPVSLQRVIVRFDVALYPDGMILFDIYEPEALLTIPELLVAWRN